MSYVSYTDDANNGDESKLCDQTENEHVAKNGLTEEQSTCQNCKKLYEKEISIIMKILNEVKHKYEEESKITKMRVAETDEKMKSLVNDNNKMTTEIASLAASVAELTLENNTIKNILDVKQTEWITIEEKSKTTPPINDTNTSLELKNRFQTLEDKNATTMLDLDSMNIHERPETSEETQILEYRSKEKAMFNALRDKQEKTPK